MLLWTLLQSRSWPDHEGTLNAAVTWLLSVDLPCPVSLYILMRAAQGGTRDRWPRRGVPCLPRGMEAEWRRRNTAPVYDTLACGENDFVSRKYTVTVIQRV